ncbi:hypothetical protein F5883DRAFT_717902 [Diaporthe sp. PMI_573]|nr:hypothetical protein F5883DRAFT_717902 [Diaporthaceae sp. PMI_573]
MKSAGTIGQLPQPGEPPGPLPPDIEIRTLSPGSSVREGKVVSLTLRAEGTLRDDYWEMHARKQGFTEADLAGDKRPGASKPREAMEQDAFLLGGARGEIVIQQEYPDTRRTDYSSIPKTRPRQEIIDPLHQDRPQTTQIPEIHTQAHHTAEYNRSVNKQSEMRTDYTNDMWRRPHEQPVLTVLNQPVSIGTAAANTPMSHATQPPYTKSEGMSQQQSGLIPIQSSQLIMTAPPFSTPIQAQNPSQSSTVRYVARVLSQPQSKPRSLSSGFTDRMLQMWPPTPQASQNVYTHNQQAQQSLHPPQSPMPKMRHSTTADSAQQGDMPYFGMPEMAQGYPAPSPCDHQTQRQYPDLLPDWSEERQLRGVQALERTTTHYHHLFSDDTREGLLVASPTASDSYL